MCLAVPGKITEITEGEGILRTGKASFGGIIRDVNLAYTPKARVGDYVIVHVGFALSVVDEKEAEQVFSYLREMDELESLSEQKP